MRKQFTIIGIILFVLISGLTYYYHTHISIWGFNISKGELSNVIINTNDNGYRVVDSKLVQKIAEEVSKMKRLNKIEPNYYPPRVKPTKYLKIDIQTKNIVNYGGSFREDSTGQIMDSNGYYWSVSKDFFDLLDNSVQGAQKIYSLNE